MSKNNIILGRDTKNKMRIPFFDNIFYWLWIWGDRRNEQAMKEGKKYRVALPERSFGIISISQYVYFIFFILLILHILSNRMVVILYKTDIRITIIPLGFILLILFLLNMKIYDEKKYRMLKNKYRGMSEEQKKKSKKGFIVYILVCILIALFAVKLWFAYSDKIKQIVDSGL